MIAESKKEKNNKIDFPLKLAFTERGMHFFINNKKKIAQIRLADNDLAHGLESTNTTFDYLQKMIRLNFISKVECGEVEYNTKKQSVIDLTKMIVYEYVNKKFSYNIYTNILTSSFISNWNRLNPTKIIDGKTKLNENLINKYIGENLDSKQIIVKLLINDFLSALNNDASLSFKEKEMKVYTGKKMILALGNFVWFIIIQSYNAKDFKEIYALLINTLADYIDKLKIADYLGLMIMELLNNAENTKVQKYIKKFYRNNDIDKFVMNKEVRDEIYDNFRKKSDTIHVSWKICGKEGFTGVENKLKVTIVNKGYNAREFKNEISEKLQRNIKSKNLYDFFKEIPEENLTKEFGYYYFTYLSDACKNMNIRFETFVNKMLGDELPLITLSFNFK